MVSANNGKIAYVTRKIIPPILPLSSTLVKEENRAKQEGKPIPNAKPQNMNTTNVGIIKENKDEITPSRIQMSKKRILETLSAIMGPIRKDIIVAAGINHIFGRSQAIEKSIVKNHMNELKIRKKIRKNCRELIENPLNIAPFTILPPILAQIGTFIDPPLWRVRVKRVYKRRRL